MKTYATASANTFTRPRTYQSTFPSWRPQPRSQAVEHRGDSRGGQLVGPREPHVRARRDRRLDERADRRRIRSWRLPGLRPCRAGVVARGGHSRALRLRLPAPRRRCCRRRCRDRTEPRLARSVDGVLAAHRSHERSFRGRATRTRRPWSRLRRRHAPQRRVQRTPVVLQRSAGHDPPRGVIQKFTIAASARDRGAICREQVAVRDRLVGRGAELGQVLGLRPVELDEGCVVERHRAPEQLADETAFTGDARERGDGNVVRGGAHASDRVPAARLCWMTGSPLTSVIFMRGAEGGACRCGSIRSADAARRWRCNASARC